MYAMVALAFSLTLASVAASASPILRVSPPSLSVSEGRVASIDVVVDPDGSMIGAFDIDLAFDSTLVAFEAIAFGSGLGGSDDVLQGVEADTGLLHVFEVSLLDTLPQDGNAFVLFTVSFRALEVGNGVINLLVNEIGDASGMALAAEVRGGAIEVTPRVTPVDEPSSLALMLAGVALVALRRAGRGCIAPSA